MTGRIALCVDEATLFNPGIVGLDGERLDSQKWIDIYTEGEEARRKIVASEDVEEAWVASCEDVEPINLAATLKQDRPELTVRLVEFSGCGSLFSRAYTAQIDEVLERAAFIRLYGEAKAFARNAGAEAVENGAPAAEPSVQAQPDTRVQPGAQVQPDMQAQPGAHAQPETACVLQPSPNAIVTSSKPNCFLLPVVSGSGGSGKSAVSAMSALVAHRMGHSVLLLDYDLQFGDMAALAGVREFLTIDDALRYPERLGEALSRNAGFFVLAAPERMESAETVAASAAALVERLSGSFDVIVANTGAAWADCHVSLLERCSAALFLVDQRASSLRACKHALDLCARCGVASGPFKFALNRCAKGAPLTPMDVSCVLQGAPVFELKDGGREVEEYLGGGAAADLLDSGNEFCESVARMVEQLLPGNALLATDQAVKEKGRFGKRRGRHANKRKGRFS